MKETKETNLTDNELELIDKALDMYELTGNEKRRADVKDLHEKVQKALQDRMFDRL